MSRLRILLLGPDCDPESVSVTFVAYSHAAALAQLHDVTLVVRAPSRGRGAPRKGAVSRDRGGPDANARAYLGLEFAQDLQIQL